MASGFWSSGAVSVILLPSGKDGAELLALAREWTANSILSPALWVSPEGVDIPEGMPPSVVAKVFALSDSGQLIEPEVDLFEALAQEELRILRLITVRSARPHRETDDLQDAVGDRVARYVRLSVPDHAAQGGGEEHAELVRASLICAPTDFQLTDRVEWAARDSSVVVVASPEDRATPNAGDAFVRDNDRFAGFELMHLASIGGLWSGIPVGTLEVVPFEASAAQSIWIPRTFVTGVITGGVAADAVAGVMNDLVAQQGAIAVGGAQAVPKEAALIPDNRVRDHVTQMASSAMSLDARALDYRVPVLNTEPARTKIGIGAQLRAFFSFGAGKVAAIPRWIRLWIHDRVAGKLERRLQGADGRRTLERRLDQLLDSRDQVLLDTSERIAKNGAQASGQRVTMGATSTPRLWTRLRNLTFGALDGSANSEEFGFEPVDGRTPVFGKLAHVVPDPEDTWESTDVPHGFPASVTWRTLRDQPGLHDALSKQVASATDAVSAQQAKVVELTANRDALAVAIDERREELLDAGLLKVRADGRVVAAKRKAPVKDESEAEEQNETPEDDGALGPDDVAQLKIDEQKLVMLSKRIESEASKIDEAEDDLRAAQQVLDSFDEWAGRQKGSFVWELLDRTDLARDRAKADLAAAESGPEAEFETGELVRLRKRFHRGVLIWAVVISMLTGLFMLTPLLARWAVATEDDPTKVRTARAIVEAIEEGRYLDWWMILLIGLAAFPVALVVLLTTYYRQWSEFERRVALLEHRLIAGTARHRALKDEVARLEAIHEQARERLELLSTALYHPWKVSEDLLASEQPSLNAERLPFAMHIAHVGAGQTDAKERLRLRVAESFIKPGWRAAAFADLVESIRRRLGLERERFGLDAIDNDLPEATTDALQRLKRLVSDDVILNEVARARVEELVGTVRGASVLSAGAKITPVSLGPFSGALSDDASNGVEWGEFLRQIVRDDTTPPLSALGIAAHEVQRAHHQKPQTVVLAPAHIARTLTDIANPDVSVHAVAQECSVDFEAIVRVDLVGPVPISAINLWSRRSPDEDASSLKTAVAVCATCGRGDCPAADPESGLPCAGSGI